MVRTVATSVASVLLMLAASQAGAQPEKEVVAGVWGGAEGTEDDHMLSGFWSFREPRPELWTPSSMNGQQGVWPSSTIRPRPWIPGLRGIGAEAIRKS
jgi:hypothetical protein